MVNNSTTEPHGWDSLPPELNYLREPAEKFGTYQFYDQRNILAHTISAEDQSELAAVADEVRDPNESQKIWAWRERHIDEPAQYLIQWLLEVINDLIPVMPKEPLALNWQKLPIELRYLREPACKYGLYWSKVAQDQLLKDISDEELEEIVRLADKVWSPEHATLIEEWLNYEVPGSPKHPEATLVHFMLQNIEKIILAKGSEF